MKFCHCKDHGSQIFCFWSPIGGAKSGINFMIKEKKRCCNVGTTVSPLLKVIMELVVI
jgi:hypothetical protein